MKLRSQEGYRYTNVYSFPDGKPIKFSASTMLNMNIYNMNEYLLEVEEVFANLVKLLSSDDEAVDE